MSAGGKRPQTLVKGNNTAVGNRGVSWGKEGSREQGDHGVLGETQMGTIAGRNAQGCTHIKRVVDGDTRNENTLTKKDNACEREQSL